jgi:hypothetical protein
MNMLRTCFSKQFYALLLKKSTTYLFCYHAHFTLPTRFYKMLSVYLLKAKKAAILSMKISTKSRLCMTLNVAYNIIIFLALFELI